MTPPSLQQVLPWLEGNGRLFSLTVAVPAHATAFIELPGGHQITLPGGPHGTQRTLAG